MDVIISEWMGNFLLTQVYTWLHMSQLSSAATGVLVHPRKESMLDTVLIARDRFLKPGVWEQ